MIVYGKQIFLYILDNKPQIINRIILAKEVDKNLFKKIGNSVSSNCKIEKVDNKKAQGLARGGNHQGLLLDIDFKSEYTIKDIKSDKFTLLLDGITDMGNIGAIFRTAYSLGVDSIVICGIKDLKLETILRTSSGSALNMKFIVHHNSAEAVSMIKQLGFEAFASVVDGVSLKQIKDEDSKDNKDKKLLIMGSEDSGISKKVLKQCDKRVKIDMKNGFDSLNVSVATAILIYGLID
jgi:23S rRNA (guanosine2251-2'-O)-methyltransferase